MTRGRPKRREDHQAAIRARGLRATPARIAVLERLESSAVAMSHGDLVDIAPTAQDRTTIFRALLALAKVGLVHRVDVGDRVWRYKIVSISNDREPPATSFVCTSCGAVEEVRIRVVSTEQAPKSVRRGQFTLFVHGICDDCG
jgi:Fur family ferric uptake transcriptional regulator